MGLATRVIAPEGIFMTTGAALPISKETMVDVDENLEGSLGITLSRDISHLSTEQLVEFEAIILRSCLAHDASSYVWYTDNEELVSPTSVPRNAPCPCGSGKKYKRCCG
ncbi:MAG: SEC-C domain-containing protein [Armatimonadetes bacterium]|nr:SEC-C domain-containing protein [Armatimonadota bacterium]